MALAEYHVIPELGPEDENQATTAMVKGIILVPQSRTAMSRQQQGEMSMKLQFLEHHRRQYLEQSNDFDSIFFMPKSRTALENMKV